MSAEIRGSAEAAEARAALAEQAAAREDYIGSEFASPAADQVMIRRIEDAQIRVNTALGILLDAIDHAAGAR